MSATRLALNRLRDDGRALPAAPANRELLDSADDADDPELQVMKARHGAHFKEAFEVALRSRSIRERNLLRMSVLDRLSVDQIAAAFSVHRATAARWVQAVRATVAARTRQHLCHALRISGPEADSLVRLVRSELDMSLSRLLRESRSDQV